MYYSIFNLFKIGIGPSSSHTVGPINAAIEFLKNKDLNNKIESIKDLTITLYGSLAHTAIGHKTINGLILGKIDISEGVFSWMRLIPFLQPRGKKLLQKFFDGIYSNRSLFSLMLRNKVHLLINSMKRLIKVKGVLI